MTQNYFKNLIGIFLPLNSKSYIAIILLVSFGTSFLNAQVSGYVFSQSSSSYAAVSSPTTLATATGNAIGVPSLDTSEFPITLPFGFVFNGQSYTEVRMSTNGYIAFGTGVATGTTPISATTTYAGVVSAFGRDLNSIFNIAGKTGNMSWSVEGTAPNRVVVIQWENFRPTYTTSTTTAYVFSFQIRLAETSNVIQTVYSAGGYLIGSTAYASTVQIGLRGATNADFNNRLNATTLAFDSSTAGIANNSSQAFSTAASPPGMPSDGLTYTWTPPTCWAPNTLSVSNITTTSADLAWTASSSAPANGYDIYYSTSNVPPTSTTTPIFSGVTGLTQSLSGLNSSSIYFVWMRSVCSGTNSSNWVILSSFNTACAPVNNMFENFDTNPTGSIAPHCWNRIISGAGSQSISITTPNSTPNNILMTSTSTANQTIVVLPVFGNISASTHWLRFKARVTTAPRTIDVGYVTNDTDASTFVNIESKSIANTAYTAANAEYTVAVPTTIPAGARLAIRNPGTTSTTLYIDDVYWEVIPTCFTPSNLAISSIGTATASVSWSAPTTIPADGYEIYYSTTNTAPTTTTVLNATNSVSAATGTTSVNITGLTHSTPYFVWVRSKCSITDLSSWSSSATFTTACLPSTSPFNQSFGTGVIPSCWNTFSTNGTAGALWKFTGAGDYGTTTALNGRPTGTYAWVDASSPYTGTDVKDVTLQTPQIDLTGIANPGIQFDWFKNHSSITTAPAVLPAYDNNRLTVMVRNVATSTWETVFASETNSPAWRTQVIALNPSYANTTIQVRFIVDKNVNGNGYFYDDLLLDEIKVNALALLGTSENIRMENNVNIYPNPFTNVINISDVKGLVSIGVTDLSGRLVKTITKPTAQINLGDLNSGMYILTLKYQNGQFKTIKAIKK